MIRRLLAKLRSRVHTFLFLERDLASPVDSIDSPPLRHIDALDHADLPLLAAFCSAAGFPADWHTDMLEQGAIALLALDPATTNPMAMGWIADRPFAVEEIGAIFDPAGGVYLFGDFVLPEFRGRRLQRILVNQRLRLAQARDVHFAHTIVAPDNAPSLKSYHAEGFITAATLKIRHWLGSSRQSLSPSRSAAVKLTLDPQGTIRPA